MRYMNQLDKVKELASWEQAKAARETAPPSGFVGGHGYPDPAIYDWVDRLNGLHRLCTLQSCAGHRCGAPPDCCGLCVQEGMVAPEQSEHIWLGELWLWLDEPLSHWFHYHALTLAADPLIEKVSVHYHVNGREIVDIVFRGDGTGQLAASMQAICNFFEDGNCTCNLG